MTILLMFAKTMFGGLINIFAKIFGDWRILLFVCVMIMGLLVWYKIHSDQKQLELTKQTLMIEQKNNETLRNNVATLAQTNQNNQAVIAQLTADKQLALDSVKTLSVEITKSNQSFSTLQRKLDQINTPPSKLTPYISQAIKGIQEERAKMNGAQQ